MPLFKTPYTFMRPFGLLACLLLSVSLLGQSAWAQPAAQQPEAAFREALQHYQADQFASAAEAFAAFRTAHPHDEDAAAALFYRAEALRKVGQADVALPLFRTFLRRHRHHPFRTEAARLLGMTLYEAGRYKESRAHLQEALDGNLPDEKRGATLLRLARVEFELGRTDEALRLFEQAAERGDTAPDALRAAGQLHMQQGRYAEAARLFDRLRREYPESAQAAQVGLARAEAYYHEGNYERAVHAVSQLPEATRPIRGLLIQAESHRRLGNLNEALEAYEALLRREASSYRARALYGRAHILQQLGRHEEAADAFREVPEDNEELARKARFWEAMNLKRTGQRDAATQQFEAFLDRWPDAALSRRATYELGVLLYQAQRWNEAHRTFTRYLQQYPEGPMRGEVVRLRGQIDADRGSLSRALRSLDEADMDNLPDSSKRLLRLQRAWLLFQQGNYDDASDAFLGVQARHAQTQTGAEALFWAGESHYRRERYDRAADLFRRYLRAHPRGERAAAARYSLAWALFAQQRYEEATSAFQRFLARYDQSDESVPYRTDARLRLGDSYFAQKNYEQAIRSYERVSGDGGAYALYQIGRAHYRMNNYEDAIASFQQLTSRYPSSRWHDQAQYTIGYLHLQQQNFEEAVQTYRELLRSNPAPSLAAQTQYSIGDALYNAGRLEDALEAYRTVLRRYPESPYVGEAAGGIQYTLTALGQEGRIQNIIQEFASTDPSIANELRFRRAEVLYQSGQTERALTAFQQFVRQSESESLLPEAYYYLGSLYADERQYPEATSYLSRLIEEFPESERRVDAARRLGSVYLEQEEYQQALRTYQKLEELRPSDAALRAEARYGQSQALMELGRLNEAEQLLEETVASASEEAPVAHVELGLAQLYERQNKLQEARRLYQQLIDVETQDVGAEALYRLGALQLKQDAPKEALETLSRMDTLFPGASEWSARAYLTQARAFRQLGQTGDAERMYDQVINQFSGTPWGQTAREEKKTL